MEKIKSFLKLLFYQQDQLMRRAEELATEARRLREENTKAVDRLLQELTRGRNGK
jgi:vacuolar-type H+-ATPase subunit D/Vma8